jgi:hypothetical protein
VIAVDAVDGVLVLTAPSNVETSPGLDTTPALGTKLPCLSTVYTVRQAAPLHTSSLQLAAAGTHPCRACEHKPCAATHDCCFVHPRAVKLPMHALSLMGACTLLPQVTLTWSAKDKAGNIGTAQQQLLVAPLTAAGDTTPPVLLVPDNATLRMGDILAAGVVRVGARWGRVQQQVVRLQTPSCSWLLEGVHYVHTRAQASATDTNDDSDNDGSYIVSTTMDRSSPVLGGPSILLHLSQ